MSDFYTIQELRSLGFSAVGENVKVSRLCSLYGISGTIGSGSRIDDFTILKGSFRIGQKVHICSHCSLSGVGGTIEIDDLVGVGVNNIFYTTSDDMLQSGLCGPLVSSDSVRHKSGPIKIGRGVALGGRVTVMPSTIVGEFSAFGVSCLLSGNYRASSIYMNVHGRLKRVGTRHHDQLAALADAEFSE